MHASLNFEDNDGAVNVVMRLEGPANASSGAHRMAIRVLEYIEKHTERLSDPVTQVDPLTQLELNLAASPLVIARGN